jgi:hypothetical protein
MTHTVKVTMEFAVDADKLNEFADDAWPGIAYWCTDFNHDAEGIKVERWNDPDTQLDGDTTTTTHTWQEVADSLAMLARGDFIHFTGERRQLDWPYGTTAAMKMLADPDDADYDADVWDHVIQQTVLGRQLYS